MVIGAAGFIGRWVTREVCRRGWSVDAVVREERAARALLERWGAGDTRLHELDLCEPGSAAALVERLQPAIVFNLAGYGVDRTERDPALAERMNHHLVAELAESAALEARRAVLMHAGSALEYGVAGGVLTEYTMPVPTTLYGQTKLRGTLALRHVAERQGSRAVTARLFTVFGAGEHEGRLFPSLLSAVRSGERLRLTDGRQRRDFAYVSDVAALLVDLALSEFTPGEAVNLAAGTMHSVRDFVEEAARQLQLPREQLEFGALPTRPEEMAHDGVSVERLRALTGRTLPGDLPAIIGRAVADSRRLT
jgi:nucleoside-diphosphate-sugar epimerase